MNSPVNPEKVKNILELWDQAGDRPYEVLIEEGIYHEFIKYLVSSIILLDDTIYRGTKRHQELIKGDILKYSYPTSWSSTLENALHFVEEEEHLAILSFMSDIPIKGIYNIYNSYGENEVILHPTIFKVIDRYDYDNYILLILEIVSQ